MLRIIPVAVLLMLLTACAGVTPPVPGADESASPTPTVTATDEAEETEEADAEPEPEPEAEPAPAPAPPPAPSITAAERTIVRNAISSGDNAAIGPHLSDTVRVILMSTECCWDISRAEAVAQLSYVSGAPGPWNFNLPAATTAPWHTNTYYGYLFTGDDITGRAADGTIISFGIEGGQITKILMGWDEGFYD